MSASIIPDCVRAMLDNPGVYITGDAYAPDATVIMVSLGGRIFSTVLDRELAPDRFLDGFVVKHGPLT